MQEFVIINVYIAIVTIVIIAGELFIVAIIHNTLINLTIITEIVVVNAAISLYCSSYF